MIYPHLSPAKDAAFHSVIVKTRELLRQLPEPVSVAGFSLLDEISSQNWYLEWNLPAWIGNCLEIKHEIIDMLTLSNIFGLGFVRLQDRFIDQDSTLDIDITLALRSFLFNVWLDQYKTLFEPGSVFWGYFEQFLGEWTRSEYEAGGPGEVALVTSLTKRSEELDLNYKFFARRGAPLKNCCAAACLLSNQVSALPQIQQGCDHLVAGMVLVDHAQDWKEDLYAGRYNAFQNFLGCIAKSTGTELGMNENQSRNYSSIEGKIIEQIYIGSKTKGYFELTRDQFRKAKEFFTDIHLMELVNYCNWIEIETTRYQKRQKKSVNQMFKLAADGLLQSGIA